MSELKNQELPLLELTQEERTKAEGMAKAILESGAPLDCIESYVLHVYARERQLSAALNELKAKDAELAAKDARIAELESYKLNADHALNLSILDSEELQSRLGAVSEVLKKYEPDLRDTIRQIRSIVEGNHAK